MNFSSQKLIFVTGKGGVGKSLCAAAVAWREAKKGKKVCLVELGNQSFYESLFETRGISYEPTELLPDLHVALFTGEECLKEYVLHFLKVPKLYDIFFQNKVMKAFLNAAPALAELAILGKLTAHLRGILNSDYDLYVVDTYSTGHALALFRAPGGLAETFRSGPIYEQSIDISRILKDPKLTHFILVTLAEEMPVAETLEFYNMLKKEFGAEISMVCNKLLSPPITTKERELLKTQVKDKHMLEFLEFLSFREEIQEQQLKKLKSFSPEFTGVPQILTAATGQDYVESFAQHMEKPWISINS